MTTRELIEWATIIAVVGIVSPGTVAIPALILAVLVARRLI